MKRVEDHSEIDAVRDATDLVQLIGEHIALRPKGREHVGLCPFHDDHSPSFAVVTHKGNAFYKCHSCGAGGDVFDFVRNYHKMDFPEALRFLAERAGITLRPRTSRTGHEHEGEASHGPSAAELREANSLASAFFRKVLQSATAGTIGRELCAKRGISDDMIEAFSIGLAPDQWDSLHNVIRKRGLSESTFASAGLLKQRSSGGGHYDAFRNRLMFPICNEVGQPVAFGARKINPEDEPKYLNSAESAIFQKSRTLYGLHIAKRAIIDARQVIVTEGYTDVIACHQAGVTNVVGTLGTALTRQHAKMLSRLCDTVVLLFDGDEAGQRAADRGVEVFFAEPVDVKICVLPDNLDPDDLLKQDQGAARLQALVAEADDALAYKIKRFRSSLQSVTGLSGRQKRFEQFMQELADLGFTNMQGVRRRLVMTQLADLLGVAVSDIEQALPAARRQHVPAQAEPGDPAVHGYVEADEADEAALQHQPVAPARSRAERGILAIALYDPEQACKPLNDGDARLVDVLECGQFIEPACRSIAEALWPRLQSGKAFAMQQVLGSFDDPKIKNMVTELYLIGRRMCGEREGEAALQLAEAVRALQAHLDHARYRESVSAFRRNKGASGNEIEAVQELLEQRRRQGVMAGAISSGARR